MPNPTQAEQDEARAVQGWLCNATGARCRINCLRACSVTILDDGAVVFEITPPAPIYSIDVEIIVEKP